MKKEKYFACVLVLTMLTACVTSPVNAHNTSSSKNAYNTSSSKVVQKTSKPTATPNTAFLKVKKDFDNIITNGFSHFNFSFEYDKDSHLYTITAIYKDITKETYYNNIDWANDWCDAFNEVAETVKQAVKEKGYGDIDIEIYWQADNDDGLLYSCKNGKDTYRLIDDTTFTPNTAFSAVKKDFDNVFAKGFSSFNFSFEYDEVSHLYAITAIYKDITKKAYYDNIDWANDWCDAFNEVAETVKQAVKDKGYGDIDIEIYWQADNDDGLLYSCKNGKDTYRLIDDTTLRISNLSNSYSHGYYTFTGTIENFLHRTVKFVKIKLELLDSNGKVVDTDWTYAVGVEGLNYRDSKPFEIIHKDSGVDWKRFRISVLEYD